MAFMAEHLCLEDARFPDDGPDHTHGIGYIKPFLWENAVPFVGVCGADRELDALRFCLWPMVLPMIAIPSMWGVMRCNIGVLLRPMFLFWGWSCWMMIARIGRFQISLRAELCHGDRMLYLGSLTSGKPLSHAIPWTAAF